MFYSFIKMKKKNIYKYVIVIESNIVRNILFMYCFKKLSSTVTFTFFFEYFCGLK